MKIFLITLLCFSLIATISAQGNIRVAITYGVECLMEVGWTAADLIKFKNDENIDDSQTKCLRFCLQKKSGLYNDDGNLQTDVALNIIEQQAGLEAREKADEIITTCKDQIDSDDPCEIAEQFSQCLSAEEIEF